MGRETRGRDRGTAVADEAARLARGQNGALRGFAAVELPVGLRLYDVAVLVGDKGLWASLPQKAALHRERRQKVSADGKPTFATVAEWKSRELSDRFSAA